MGYVSASENYSVEAARKRLHAGDSRSKRSTMQWGLCVREHRVHRIVAEWIDSNGWRALHEWRGMHGNGRPDFSADIDGLTYAIECKTALRLGAYARFYEYTMEYDAVIVVCSSIAASRLESSQVERHAAHEFNKAGIGLRLSSAIDRPIAVERPIDRRSKETRYDYSCVTRRLLANDLDLLWNGSVVSAHGWHNDIEEERRKDELSEYLGYDVRSKRWPMGGGAGGV